jgi:alpha-tubulin suppressor-like RCC1 family protein
LIPTTGGAAVTGGERFSCAALSNGQIYCWGRNDRGQLGDGTTFDSPVGVVVNGATGHFASAGSDFACAVTLDGSIECWGCNSNGQLGDGSTNDSPFPVEVSGF